MKKIFVLFLFTSLYSMGFSQCPDESFLSGSISGKLVGTTGHYTSTLVSYYQLQLLMFATGGSNIGVTNANTFAIYTGKKP